VQAVVASNFNSLRVLCGSLRTLRLIVLEAFLPQSTQRAAKVRKEILHSGDYRYEAPGRRRFVSQIKMADYEFVTTWRLKAPQEQVWDLIFHSENWPEWWPGVEKVEKLKDGDLNHIGVIHRYTWKSI
jgi:hypothetical protein